MHKKRNFFNLQTTITLLVCSVVALSLLVTDILMSKEVSSSAQKSQAEKAANIARIAAHSSIVIEALSGKRPEKDIQTYAAQLKSLTDVQFIVVMDMQGIRKSHPDVKKIGKHFVGGDEGAALHGKEHISTAKGTLGYSLRAFSPIYSPNGKQIGAVAVGISLDNVKQYVQNSRKMIFIAVGLGILTGIIGALILARKIKNSMFGLEPFEISKLLEERNAMLESTKEGILAVDQSNRITLINHEGIRLLKEAGINHNPVGQSAENYFSSSIQKVLENGTASLNEEIQMSGITLLSNILPISVKKELVGAVMTFRDKTEMNQLAEELTGVKLYAEALRAQSHEFMNKMHVILGLVHLKHYDKLAGYVSDISEHLQNEVGFITKKIKDPALAGFILGKMSYARECGSELIFDGEGIIPEPQSSNITHDLITILGNLADNALDALNDQENKQLSIYYEYFPNQLFFEVADNGPGFEPKIAENAFSKGVSSKGDDRGIGLYLVKSTIEKLNGEIELSSSSGAGSRISLTIPYFPKDGEG